MRNKPTLAPRLLKTTQAAKYLAISPWQLRKLIAEGLIPVVQAHNGARFLLDVRDLDGYIDRNKVTRESH